MADEKHLEIFRKGVKVWNQWRKDNPDIKPNLESAILRSYDLHLSGVDFTATNLYRADLTSARLYGADFTVANLHSAKLHSAKLNGAIFKSANLTSSNLEKTVLNNTNFTGAILTHSNLTHANLENVNFTGANLTHANLTFANFTIVNFTDADFTETDLTGADLTETDLTGAILKNADLRYANLDSVSMRGTNLQSSCLKRADLENADLENANLKNANLKKVQALATNFERANFTGACIEDWNINKQTNLKNVKCDYIYLKGIYSKEEKWIYSDRCPHDPNKIFAPGEFTKLFQKAFETVDLLFQNGVDWQAVAYSLKNIQVLNKDIPLTIQKVENKGDGDVLISVNVPEDANKGKIAGDFWQGYEFAQKTLESQYQARLDDKDKEINRLFYLVNQQRELIGDRNIQGNYYEQSGNLGIGQNNGNISENSNVAGQINEAAPPNLAQDNIEIGDEL